MKYLLDTDTLIYFLKGDENVVRMMGNHALDRLTTSIINHSELLFGAFNSSRKQHNLNIVNQLLDKINILPFCKEASSIFAEQKAILRKKGQILADLDLLIASIAIKNKCVLVTNNDKHFSRIKPLKLENWHEK